MGLGETTSNTQNVSGLLGKLEATRLKRRDALGRFIDGIEQGKYYGLTEIHQKLHEAGIMPMGFAGRLYTRMFVSPINREGRDLGQGKYVDFVHWWTTEEGVYQVFERQK
ncbi:MAG TPA: hypothetical protein VJJ52_00645 [Candidatus Nanoarchaeia archaeon]|nr:hypothetical protein [Candidatus Nanoarchaeia archaeon]